jgi:uncharacterized lipoprotein YmbA
MRKIVIISLTLLLVGCVSGSEIPQNHYYRLTEVNIAPVSSSRYKDIKLYVTDIQVSGLLNERSLLYTKAGRPNELMKYFYHQWEKSPSVMLRDHLMQYLQSSAIFSSVNIYSYQKDSAYLLNTRLDKMEVSYSADKTALIVDISFELKNDKGKVIFLRLYKEQLNITSRDMYSLVTGYSHILETIYLAMSRDLQSL